MVTVATESERTKREQLSEELATIYAHNDGLNPQTVVDWAREHTDSALHNRFQWDDSVAAEKYRLYQARMIIVEVTVEYPDGKERQVYVSPVERRGKDKPGYSMLVTVLNDKQKREAFLAQALVEFEVFERKYADLKEFACVFSEIRKVRTRAQTGARKSARRPRTRPHGDDARG